MLINIIININQNKHPITLIQPLNRKIKIILNIFNIHPNIPKNIKMNIPKNINPIISMLFVFYKINIEIIGLIFKYY